MERSKEEARREGIVVPETIDEYCIKEKPSEEENLDCLDFGTFFHSQASGQSAVPRYFASRQFASIVFEKILF